MKISEQLLQCAIEVRRGWCQGRAFIGDNGCSIGIIYRVGGPTTTYVTVGMLKGYLKTAINQSSIVAWNDTCTQTQENVAQAFELAAILAEQDEARIGVSDAMPECVEVAGIMQ